MSRVSTYLNFAGCAEDAFAYYGSVFGTEPGPITRLYQALADGGSDSTDIQAMPWGHWGCTLDRFGIRWMFNAPAGT